MQPFAIFKTGKHTASGGQTLDFGEELLRGAVAAYDPELHPAPIVVGHPKDNHPAFGWVGGLEFNEDGKIVATPDKVNPEFAEMVKAGSYRTRSASWYLPDSPANPKPGTLYLRHVGFLGAQPPAIKGLGDVQFNEAEGVVEFVDGYSLSSIARLMRGMREFFIGKFGKEEADAVIPDYAVADLEHDARKAMEAPAQVMPAFSEPTPTEQDTMTAEEIKALQDKLAATEAEAATLRANQKPADFAEREARLVAAEAKAARDAVEAKVDAVIADGRLKPAQRTEKIDFAMALDDASASLDFGEGDKAAKLSLRAHFLAQLAQGEKVVEFGEFSAPKAGESDEMSAIELGLAARDFAESQYAKGIDISPEQAVEAVKAGKHKTA